MFTKKFLKYLGWVVSIYAILVLPLGFGTGFLHLQVVSPTRALLLTGLLFVFPSLVEEWVMRGLIYTWLNPKNLLWHWANFLNLFVFILYHPLNALTFYPRGNPTFLDPFFLLAAGLLGLGVIYLRWKTGSIWYSVILHYLVVWIWIIWLGGDGLLS